MRLLDADLDGRVAPRVVRSPGPAGAVERLDVGGAVLRLLPGGPARAQA